MPLMEPTMPSTAKRLSDDPKARVAGCAERNPSEKLVGVVPPAPTFIDYSIPWPARYSS